MTATKDMRQRIAGLEKQIDQHERKIRAERQREQPDVGLINHWESEIRVWRNKVSRLQERMGGRKGS